MHRLRTVTSLDVSAVAGHHAMPAALLLVICVFFHWVIKSLDILTFCNDFIVYCGLKGSI